jgi:hypothetical protein
MKLSNVFLEIHSDLIKSFEPHDNLNPKIWDENGKLREFIRIKLLKLANEYYRFLEIDADINDIIFTGSLANFNWSSEKFSDIDLHIVVNYNQIDENTELVTKYMFNKKKIWGDTYDINILGYPVEVFCQDANQHSPFDAGVYSVANDTWIQKPTQGIFHLQAKEVVDKAKHYEKMIREVLKKEHTDINWNEYIAEIDSLKEKIHELRGNLGEGGEFDINNLVYKYLRREGLFDKLDQSKVRIKEKMFSVKEKPQIDIHEKLKRLKERRGE